MKRPDNPAYSRLETRKEMEIRIHNHCGKPLRYTYDDERYHCQVCKYQRTSLEQFKRVNSAQPALVWIYPDVGTKLA